MDHPAAKRRKFESAAAVLSRPFKSPLKRPSLDGNPQTAPDKETGLLAEHKPGHQHTETISEREGDELTEGEASTSLQGKSAIDAQRPSQAVPQPHEPSTRGQPSTSQSAQSIPHSPSNAETPRTKRAAKNGAEDTSSAQQYRQTCALNQRVRDLRRDIDTLSQAAKIASSPRDDELRALVDKWRAASRTAAEELFAGAKDRVNRMGGVGGWQDAERARKARMKAWEEDARAEAMAADNDDDDGFENDDEEEDEQEGENGLGMDRREKQVLRWELKQQRRERREAAEAEQGADETEQAAAQQGEVEEYQDDDAFTMDMMLRVMNIDLDLIGWDKNGQRWAD